jgi:hypothetical protein
MMKKKILDVSFLLQCLKLILIFRFRKFDMESGFLKIFATNVSFRSN